MERGRVRFVDDDNPVRRDWTFPVLLERRDLDVDLSVVVVALVVDEHGRIRRFGGSYLGPKSIALMRKKF